MVLTALSAAAALGSTIYSAWKSKKQNDEADALIEKQRQKNKEWYNIERSRDYTQRADVQAAITRQRELLNEQAKRSRATSAVAGGTDASQALEKEAAARSLAQTTTDVAAQGAAHKDAVEQQYRAEDAALNQQQVQGKRAQAAATAQAGAQATNAALNVMGNDIYADALKGGKAETAGTTPVARPEIASAVNPQQDALNETIRQQALNKLGIPKKIS